jgi:hypothetical protein
MFWYFWFFIIYLFIVVFILLFGVNMILTSRGGSCDGESSDIEVKLLTVETKSLKRVSVVCPVMWRRSSKCAFSSTIFQRVLRWGVGFGLIHILELTTITSPLWWIIGVARNANEDVYFKKTKLQEEIRINSALFLLFITLTCTHFLFVAAEFIDHHNSSHLVYKNPPESKSKWLFSNKYGLLFRSYFLLFNRLSNE